MRLKFSVWSFAIFSLLLCVPVLAQQTKIEALKPNVTKEMRIQGVSAWRYGIQTSQSNIKVEVAQYARDGSGKFQRKHVFSRTMLNTNRPLKNGRLSFFWQDKTLLVF